MDQKGGEKQRPATGEEEGVNVQRIRVSPGQDTEVSIGGAEVREAVSHSSWEGTRLHCRMCRFLKIKTGPETACVWWLVSPLPPIAIPKSFHPVPSICRAILVNIPSLKQRRKNQEEKTKRKPKLQPYAARPYTR